MSICMINIGDGNNLALHQDIVMYCVVLFMVNWFVSVGTFKHDVVCRHTNK